MYSSIRSLTLLLAAAALAASLAGCATRDKTVAADGQRFGALGQVVLVESGPLDPAELLAVGDSALFIVYERRITLTPFRGIESATFPRNASRPLVHDGRPPGDSARARLIRLARFPSGMPPERLDSLLKAYGQIELGVLAR